jgi:predicted phosphodiesterase
MNRVKSIAILSDIHANLPALEATLDELAELEGLVGTYHLGDLVGYAPWPNEVVALLRERGIPGIQGNYDSTVATHYEHCGCGYKDPKDVELAHLSYSWTLEHVSEPTSSFLGALPFRLDLRPWGGHLSGPRIILVHGTPVLNTVYWTEDRPDEFSLQMGERLRARTGDTVVFGHTHKPWHRTIEGINFVNAGSVGRPKDGDWRACCLLLHFPAAKDQGEIAEVRVEFLRVEYDLARAQEGIRASALPEEFALVLENGGSV